MIGRVPKEIEVADCRGIDVGLKDLIVDDRGHKIPAPKFYRRTERKLKRAQRKVSKAKLQGKNRAQAKTKLAKLHCRVKSQRQDYLHKTTFHLINDHEAIGIETLNTKAMTKTKLAKSVLDASFGEIKRQLEDKGLWNLGVLSVRRYVLIPDLTAKSIFLIGKKRLQSFVTLKSTSYFRVWYEKAD